MNEITIGDKTYISAKRAAEITGYARDYVGQLCREGHVDAKMVGRSWYVYEPAIRAHRFGEEAVKEPVAPAEQTANADPVPAETQEEASGWKRPTYTAESPEMLPELESPRLEELLPPAEETLTDMQTAWREWFEQRQAELSVPEIESPEVIDERNEAQETAEEAQEAEESEEVSIPLHHIEEEPEEAEEAAEIIPIRPIAAPQHAVPAPVRPQHVDISVPVAAPARYYAEPTVIEHGKIVSERIVRPQDARKPSKKGSSARTASSKGSYAPMIALLIGISLIAITVAAIGTGYATRYLSTLPGKNNPIIKYLVGTREFTR